MRATLRPLLWTKHQNLDEVYNEVNDLKHTAEGKFNFREVDLEGRVQKPEYLSRLNQPKSEKGQVNLTGIVEQDRCLTEAKTSSRDSAGLAGACSRGKFVASRTGEAYDARVRRYKSEIRG